MRLTDSSYSPEDKLLLAHVEDLIHIANQKHRPKFSFFLNEREREIVNGYAQKQAPDLRIVFWGGYERAQRVVFGVCVPFIPLEAEQFPIRSIAFTFRKQDSLSHRDFLGALMSLQIKRECIGDILVGEGRAVVICTDVVAPLVTEIAKVGRVGVYTSLGIPADFITEPSFRELSVTVASYRLDAIVAACTRLSREKSAKWITNGLVSVNHHTVEQSSSLLKIGDCLSIRGYGRFLLHQEGGTSKKNRIHLTILKYQ